MQTTQPPVASPVRSAKAKVVGVGLNKTATKSLAHCLQELGYKNQSYSLDAFKLYKQAKWPELYTCIDEHDSFEDWPWPLMYQQIDKRYPDARFILTVRKTPETWYRSLCKMAVRMGPLKDFEQHIYGYAMPQAAPAHHIAFYKRHNEHVRAYFADRPEKLLEICFDNDIDLPELCRFLGEPPIDLKVPHENRSAPVYAGTSLWLAHANRLIFQAAWYGKRMLKHHYRRWRHRTKNTARHDN